MPSDALRCEPPEEHRGKRWHWIKLGSRVECANWDVGRCMWWRVEWSDPQSPREMAMTGWRWLAPALPPEPKGESDAG